MKTTLNKINPIASWSWGISKLLCALSLSGASCFAFAMPATPKESLSPSISTSRATDIPCQSSYVLRLQEIERTLAKTHGQAESASLHFEAAQQLILMGRYQLALDQLQQALAQHPHQALAAAIYIALGNTQVELGRRDLAQQAYQQAVAAQPDAMPVAISVALNQLALKQTYQLQSSHFDSLAQQIAKLPDSEEKARFLVQFFLQEKRLANVDKSELERGFVQALRLAQENHADYLQVEVIDALAQLMEEQQRDSEALQWSESAILKLQAISAPELMIGIEARRARVFARHHDWQQALKSYRAAVHYIQQIRQDIPVSYAQGKSSLREIIDPVYLGLAETLLKLAEHQDANQAREMLYQVRDVVEQIKQNQLDDYLGNRCNTAAVRQTQGPLHLAAGTAVLYPVIFPDRLELLLESGEGIQRFTVPIKAEKLAQDAFAMASALRAKQSYLPVSRRLYKALLAPIDASVKSQQIKTLVVVPDGPLRLLAFSALHDGQEYALQKYAIAVSPGLRIIAQQGNETQDRAAQRKSAKADQLVDGKQHHVLLAGLSEPGAVVERLPDELLDQLLQGEQEEAQNLRGKAAQLRALRGNVRELGSNVLSLGVLPASANAAAAQLPTVNLTKEDQQAIAARLRQILRLEGVDAEMRSLQSIVTGTAMINQDFTATNFAQSVRSGQYDVVHVASHGIFGSTAEKTFILAHDDVITIDQFQTLLSADKLKNSPLDLLILSACETAEGDDRAPLGISGAALKAKARSAMGSLWPVSDAATSRMMTSLYRHYVQEKKSKAESLRLAQLELLEQAEFAHPAYWAAFIMVGNWQ